MNTIKSKFAQTLLILAATWMQTVPTGIVSAVESKNCKGGCEIKTFIYTETPIAGAGGLETEDEAIAAAIAAGYSSGSFDVRLDEGMLTWSAYTSGPDPQTDPEGTARCAKRQQEPNPADRANNPGEITLDEFDVDLEAQDCTSCSNNSDQSINQKFKKSPSGVNMDIGLGRNKDGVPYGRLRFGFDLAATEPADRFSLNYAPDKGRFFVEEFVDSNGSTVLTSPSTGRLSNISNSQIAMSFAWTTNAESDVTQVVIQIIPTDVILNPGLSFKSCTITLTKDDATDTLTIKKEVTSPTVAGGKLISEWSIAPTPLEASGAYEWNMTRPDGVAVHGNSYLETSPVHGSVRSTAITETKGTEVISRNYTQKVVQDVNLIVFASVQRGGITHSQAYTYHEGLDDTDPRYHKVRSVTYRDGSWVAYPQYDAEGDPTEELRPFGDLPATPEEGLMNPSLCKRAVTTVEVKTSEMMFEQMKAQEMSGLPVPDGVSVPACEIRITEEYVRGVQVATVIQQTDIVPCASLGTPFSNGTSLDVDWVYVTKNATRDGHGKLLDATWHVLPLATFSENYHAWTATLVATDIAPPNNPGAGVMTLRRSNFVYNAKKDYFEEIWPCSFDPEMGGSGAFTALVGQRRAAAKSVVHVNPYQYLEEDILFHDSFVQAYDVLSTTTNTDDPYGSSVVQGGKNIVKAQDLESSESLDPGSPLIKTVVSKRIEMDDKGVETVTYTAPGASIPYKVAKTDGPYTLITQTGFGQTTWTTYGVGGTFQMVETQTVDVLGRVLSHTSRDALTTTTTYDDVARQTVETLPGGGQRITTRYRDGQIKSITGSALVPEFYSYSVAPNGNLVQVIHYGTATGLRWRKITSDALGRTLHEETPAPPDGSGVPKTLLRSTTYDYSGRVTAVAMTGGLTKLYAYNQGTNEMTITTEGLDANGNGKLDVAQDFNVIEKITSYFTEGVTAWQQEESILHGVGLGSASQRITITLTKLNLGPDSYEEVVEPDGTKTVTHRTLTAASKLVDETVSRGTTTTAPILVRSSTWINGMLGSVMESNFTIQGGRNEFYRYDALDRLSVIDGGREAEYKKIIYRTTADGKETTLVDQSVLGDQSLQMGYPGLTTSFLYDAAGRVVKETTPAGFTRYAYDAGGRLTHQWGTASYPVRYTYDGYGQLATMETFNSSDANLWSADIASPPPVFNSESGQETHWHRDNASAVLTGKKDAAGRTVTYLYDEAGRVSQRTWARGVTTTYGYDAAGRLASQTYSDGTPLQTYVYSRGGDLLSVTDAFAKRETKFVPGTAVYSGEALKADPANPENDAGVAALGEVLFNKPVPTIVSGKSRQTFSISRAGVLLYDTQRDSYMGGGVHTVYSHGAQFSYAYDKQARIVSITPANKTSPTATPVNIANAIHTRKFFGDGRVSLWLYGGAMTSTTLPTTIHSGWQVSYDNAWRRDNLVSLGNTAVVTLGNASTDGTAAFRRAGWDYGYNARSEVTAAQRTAPNATNAVTSPGPLVAGQALSYAYDNLGNRLQATQGEGTVATTSYTSGTDPNTYGSITHPDIVEITGLTGTSKKANTKPVVALHSNGLTAANTTLTGQDTLGEALSFRAQMTLTRTPPATTEGRMALATVTTTDTANAANKARAWVYVPPKNETLTYDEDGNLKSDGRWLYTWDAENRLVRMEERALAYDTTQGATAPPRQQLEFVYDAQHRRCAKRVFRRNAANTTWDLWAYTIFLYEGWNLVAELDVLNKNAVVRSYVWGTDLSGTQQGAGGVGGLLLVKHYQKTSTTDKSVRYLVHSDTNGNVMGLFSINSPYLNKMVGTFDYDPFGQPVVNTLPVGLEACPFRFSTKYEDKETGMLYYGYRFLKDGRWISRDPIEEQGGLNLYGFVGNDAVNRWDYLGLVLWGPFGSASEAAKYGAQWAAHLTNQLRIKPFTEGQREYGGSVCRCISTNEIAITEPVKGKSDHIFIAPCPEGTTRLAVYHSHPWVGVSSRYNGKKDMANADAEEIMSAVMSASELTGPQGQGHLYTGNSDDPENGVVEWFPRLSDADFKQKYNTLKPCGCSPKK